ncbi:PepSY domain-containing protein [Kitasatospora phosalacinea]|uniref:PepSY domain-containing protein n=1 Tax=Kitasatospora phosalacinea TaxID=2065 RepID=UPI003646BA1D
MSEPQSPEFASEPESAAGSVSGSTSESVSESASEPVSGSASEPAGLTKSPLPEAGAAGAARRRPLRLAQRRGARWVAGAAVVVVLGVVAVGAGAAWERHHGEGVVPFERARAVKALPGLPGVPDLPEGPGTLVVRGEDGSVRSVVVGGAPGGPFSSGADGDTGGRLAPAALPAVPADQALAKAVAAVPDGRAAALAVVGREGGGSSWSVEVLGADGVRHLVTVDGTDGSVTGNTVAGGR